MKKALMILLAMAVGCVLATAAWSLEPVNTKATDTLIIAKGPNGPIGPKGDQDCGGTGPHGPNGPNNNAKATDTSIIAKGPNGNQSGDRDGDGQQGPGDGDCNIA